MFKKTAYFHPEEEVEHRIEEALFFLPRTEEVHKFLSPTQEGKDFRKKFGWSYSSLAEIRWLLIEAGAPDEVINKWQPYPDLKTIL